MARVGDELLLLLGAAHHGVDGPAREQHDKQKYEQNTRCVGHERPDEHRAHRAQLMVTVEKDGDISAVIRLCDEEAVAAKVAVALAVRERGGEIFLRIILRDGGDIVEVCLCQRAA